jgi:hypothetical protein
MPEATSSGEPDAGNLHVRFDEGRGTSVPSYSTGSVLAALCRQCGRPFSSLGVNRLPVMERSVLGNKWSIFIVGGEQSNGHREIGAWAGM